MCYATVHGAGRCAAAGARGCPDRAADSSAQRRVDTAAARAAARAQSRRGSRGARGQSRLPRRTHPLRDPERPPRPAYPCPRARTRTLAGERRHTEANLSATGVRVRHRRDCRSHGGGRCSCAPSYEASVFSVRDGKKLRKTFATLAEARDWRVETAAGVRKGAVRAPQRTTLREAAHAWLAGAEDGTVRSRTGTPFKPSTIRVYRQSLRDHVLPELGGARFAEISLA